MNNTDLDTTIIRALEKITTIFRSLLQEHAQKLHLSPIQIQFLIYLNTQNSELRRVSHLAKAFGITQATVSDSLRVLYEKGLLSRKQLKEDKRVIILNLTKSGVKIAKKVETWTDILKPGFRNISDTEKKGIIHFFSELLLSLHEQGKLPAAKICLFCENFAANVHPESQKPHHCHFLDTPISDSDIQIECPHHRPRN